MIVYVQGVKGGSGKSTIGRFAVDYFIGKGRKTGKRPLVIDTDSGNCDVARSYLSGKEGKDCDAMAVDSSKESGFGEVLTAIYEAGKDGRDVIVNTGARNADEMREFGPALIALCADAGFDLVTLWALDTDTVCLEQLKKYLETMGDSRIVIMRNLGMVNGDKAKFDFVDKTNIGQAIPSVFFPNLSDSVTSLLKSPNCKAVHELEDSLTMGQRYIVRGQLAAAKQAIIDALAMAKKAE